MAGIDNITNEILQEAKNRAAGVIADATGKADAQIREAQKECESIAAKAAEKAAQEAKAYANRIVSQAGMRKRQAVLSAKQEIIGGVLDAAYKKLSGLQDKDYFEIIAKLIGKTAHDGDGEILFSEKDLARLPSGFADQVKALAAKAGGSLKVSGEAADIENGFILRYGGIEENCTLPALFAEKRDALSDKVHEILW